MALQKPIEHPKNGATAAYWRIVRISLDGELPAITIAGYLNKATSDARKDAIYDIAFTLDVPNGTTNLLAYIYTEAKKRAEFSGASDV